MSRAGIAALLATLLAGCFVTTDENLWRQRHEAGADTSMEDGKNITDAPSAEGVTADAAVTDLPAADGPAADVVPPDAPPPADTAKKLPGGSPCSSGKSCVSGHCTDGVCCASKCGGTCAACDLPGHVGVCWPVAAGQDPDNECAKQATSSCGRDGMCDGKGACRPYASGTVCAATTCVTATSSQGKQCDGKGTCGGGSLDDCLPYVCLSSTGTCRTSCNIDGHCVAYRCSPFSSKCYASCFNSWQCKSGYSCKSKVCLKS